jgi:hypothetical protein
MSATARARRSSATSGTEKRGTRFLHMPHPFFAICPLVWIVTIDHDPVFFNLTPSLDLYFIYNNPARSDNF